MLTFRIAITSAVTAFILALAAALILTHVAIFHAAAGAAAAAAMDTASATTLNRLEGDISELGAVVRILSSSPVLAGSNDRSEADPALSLFRTALRELPQADSFYVGYDNGCWLQVRRVDVLNPQEQQLLEAPPDAVLNVNLVRPATGGTLPMHRIFENAEAKIIKRLDLPDYGYDARTRAWYRDTTHSDRSLVSAPYVSFSLRTPMITLSAPLRGDVRGVVAADLKLDKFSELVEAQRPGKHGIGIIFDAFGMLIAHPEFAQLVTDQASHSSSPRLPEVRQIRTGLAGAVMRQWDGSERFEGRLRDGDGSNYLFRLRKFSHADEYAGYSLFIAAEDDFVPDVKDLQQRGAIIGLIVAGSFLPAVWFFGNRMSSSLKRLRAQAGNLRLLAAPDAPPITSSIAELADLGATLAVAQRTIWSFARFVPKDIVKGIIDGSITTELGGARQEMTILFTDVENFTGIAEAADPDALMRQTTRHFTALTQAFLEEGGTIDKYIGDSVMVFWNAPHPQSDHVERACRAALAAKAANDSLNSQFSMEGLLPFKLRLGIHCGEAVIGNVGSAERIDYTALGNTVNLAARLESLNKQYGTTILVSEAVCQTVEDRFRFRAVASVTAKGMSTETKVYELIGALA